MQACTREKDYEEELLMENPTESFLQKVEEVADASYRLRGMLNWHGGYEQLPAHYQGHVQQAVAMLESKEKSR